MKITEQLWLSPEHKVPCHSSFTPEAWRAVLEQLFGQKETGEQGWHTTGHMISSNHKPLRVPQKYWVFLCDKLTIIVLAVFRMIKMPKWNTLEYAVAAEPKTFGSYDDLDFVAILFTSHYLWDNLGTA